MNLISELPAGPLDIVGDVHGEIGALRVLLERLGYSDEGSHPDGRRMVFLGDLVDRGPDSPAVLGYVKKLVEAGHAQCVLGNHDLNLLLDAKRKDNDWWNKPGTINPKERSVSEKDKATYRKFLGGLPLVLQRTGGPEPIRIVHAAWDDLSVGKLTRDAGPPFQSVKDLHDHYKREIDARWKGTHDAATWGEEHERIAKINPGLADTEPNPGFLDAHARKDSDLQTGNPIKLITSGFEVPVKNRIPFKAGGKWRFVERMAWWEDYPDNTPVIVGHYFRSFEPAPGYRSEEDGPDLFRDTQPLEWLGKRQSVYCVDFGVGGRSRNPGREHYFSLAALRVPEWEIAVDHDSSRRRTSRSTI